jgi:hypothetical protein
MKELRMSGNMLKTIPPLIGDTMQSLGKRKQKGEEKD